MIVPIAGGSGGASGNPNAFPTGCSGNGGGGGGAVWFFGKEINSVTIASNGANGETNNNGDGGGGSGIDFGTVPIEVEHSNTGVYSLASGDAKLEPREDRTDFSVEIEDVPVGSYGLRIGGTVVGTIEVMQLQDGSVEGEIEFRDPVEPGKVLLDFDPRGQQIDVLEGDTVVLQTLFPSS